MSNNTSVLINDVRGQEDFAGISFSLFKRSQVRKSLYDSIVKGSIEAANYWAAELICCGCLLEIWETLLEVIGRHIYTANVKLPVIIVKLFLNFKSIATSDQEGSQLSLRNNMRIRKVISETVTILCLSRKKNKLDYVKVSDPDDFDINILSRKMKAPNTEFATKTIRTEDPVEIFVAINELGFNLTQPIRNSMMAHYWIEWILLYEKKCRKRKEKCECTRREFAPQAEASGKDISFLIWDVILGEAKSRNNRALLTILENVLELFKIRFTSGTKRKRRHLLYYATILLCEPYDLSIQPIEDEAQIMSMVKNLDAIYQQVKQSEVHVKENKPKTEKEAKLQKKQEKMDILVTMGT